MKGCRNSSIWSVEAALQLDVRMQHYRFLVGGRGHGKGAAQRRLMTHEYPDSYRNMMKLILGDIEELRRKQEQLEQIADKALAHTPPLPEIAGVRWDCRRPTQPPTKLELLMQQWFDDPVAKARMQAILDRKANNGQES